MSFKLSKYLESVEMNYVIVALRKSQSIKRWEKVCLDRRFYRLNGGFPTTIAQPILGKNVIKWKNQIKDNFPFKFHSSEFVYLFKWGRFWLLKLSTPKWITNLCGVPQLVSIAPKALTANNFCNFFPCLMAHICERTIHLQAPGNF
jgi:hypothetical protein